MVWVLNEKENFNVQRIGWRKIEEFKVLRAKSKGEKKVSSGDICIYLYLHFKAILVDM